MGGAYAVEKVTKGNKSVTVATATAGNHGRSVSWGAQRLGLNCKIFISEFVSEARAEVMRNLGADVIRVKGNYEASLKECINQLVENDNACFITNSFAIYDSTYRRLLMARCF